MKYLKLFLILNCSLQASVHGPRLNINDEDIRKIQEETQMKAKRWATLNQAFQDFKRNLEIGLIDPKGFNLAEELKETHAEILDAHKRGILSEQELRENLTILNQQVFLQYKQVNKEILENLSTEQKNTDDNA